MTDDLDYLRSEIRRLRVLLNDWGSVLVAEGRLTINDARSALYGGEVGPVRSNPLADEYRQGFADGCKAIGERKQSA